MDTSVVSQDSRPVESGIQLLYDVLIGEPAPEIVTLEAQIRAAQLTSDVAALNILISEKLLFTGHDGYLGSKAQDLEAHRSGFFRFKTHEPVELRVSWLRPDVAVSSLLANLRVEVAGSLIEGTFRYTRVWASEDDGVWRVVAGHVSEVQKP
jgi:ketosteroid isomerase-like protein